MLLVAVLLVNLPWVHDAWVEHRISSAGHTVDARVVAASAGQGRYLVGYRVPGSRRTFTARVEPAVYRRAVRSRQLPVRVVPGSPAENRPVGEVRSSFFVVVAAVGDALVLVILALGWSRRRRRGRRVVVRVEGDLVTLTVGGHELTAVAPQSWADRRTPGEAVDAALHLEASGDQLPCLPVSEVHQDDGARYRLRGRVVDADGEHVLLRLDDGLVLDVRPGGYRNRADLGEYAEVTGRLVLTPR